MLAVSSAAAIQTEPIAASVTILGSAYLRVKPTASSNSDSMGSSDGPMAESADGESVFESYNRGYNVGVGGAVVRDGRLLLVRRASRYGRGNWQIPGGFIERDESLEEAVVREIEEEGGVVATCRGILAIRNRIHDGSNSTYVVFLMDWVSGEPSPDGIETDRAEWLTLKEIERLENRPAINLVVAEGALSGSARLLSGTEVESGTGDTYKLFVG